MKQQFRHGTKKYISFHRRFAVYFKVLLVCLFIALAVAAVLLLDIDKNDKTPKAPISKATVKKITFDDKYFSTPYFKFTDSGKWNFIKSQSTASKFVFQKFLPGSTLVQHQLTVYINSTPPPLDLAASRVLPVGLNDAGNGFVPTQVSEHCGKTYKPGELHKVMLRQVNGSTLLCDPDQGQFRVVIAKEGGDYNLRLKRADGSFANYIIIYQNQKIDPDADTIMQVAGSFQAI